MQLGDQLGAIVNTIVNDIQSKVQADLAATIEAQVKSAVSNFDFDTKLSELADPKIAAKINDYAIDTAYINAQIGQIGQTAITNLKETIATQVAMAAEQYVKDIDVTPLVEQAVENYVRAATFPERSISHRVLNLDQFELSGDYIKGGIIRQFGSTGIEDKATQCQLTIMDNAVVIEQPLLAPALQVKGNQRIEGNLRVDGVFVSASNAVVQLENDIVNKTLNLVEREGLVTPKLVWKDKTLLDENNLAPTIINSNLRRVGRLEELQTAGDTLLDGTLFVTKKRVGVNTLEPTYALSVWDEEVEVAIHKLTTNRAFIGTERPFNVTLGANGKENISLEVDGSVTINDLRLGALPISTASGLPNWEGRAGEIVFNDSPKIGQPIGWVCLQGHRWANFGLISE